MFHVYTQLSRRCIFNALLSRLMIVSTTAPNFTTTLLSSNIYDLLHIACIDKLFERKNLIQNMNISWQMLPPFWFMTALNKNSFYSVPLGVQSERKITNWHFAIGHRYPKQQCPVPVLCCLYCSDLNKYSWIINWNVFLCLSSEKKTVMKSSCRQNLENVTITRWVIITQLNLIYKTNTGYVAMFCIPPKKKTRGKNRWFFQPQ